MTQDKKVIGAVAIATAAMLWGLDGVVLTPRLFNLNAGFVVFMLHAIPFVLMNLFLFGKYKELRSFTAGDWGVFSLVALLGGSLGTLALVKALFLVDFNKLSLVILLQKLQPVFAISLAALLLGERCGKGFVRWASLAVAASYFLTFGWQFPNLHADSKTAHAAALALLGAFSFASATVLGKKALYKFSFSTATFYRFGFTSVIMFVYVILMGQTDQFAHITNLNWLIFFIIAFTTGSGAIFLFYYGLRRVEAMVSAICELTFPISALVFDYFINGNKLSLLQWISALVMIAAITRISLVAAAAKKEAESAQ